MIDRAVEMVHFADFYYALILGINLHLSLVDVITFKTPEDDPTLGTDDKIEVCSQLKRRKKNLFSRKSVDHYSIHFFVFFLQILFSSKNILNGLYTETR